MAQALRILPECVLSEQRRRDDAEAARCGRPLRFVARVASFARGLDGALRAAVSPSVTSV